MGNLPTNGNLPIEAKGISNIGWSNSQYRLQDLPVVGIATVFTLACIICTYNHITVWDMLEIFPEDPTLGSQWCCFLEFHQMVLDGIYVAPYFICEQAWTFFEINNFTGAQTHDAMN